ncbi:bifunctional pirin family protein/GNAT family N-acetyltransferase [Streptomyces sp. WAC06614]|uniref:bifunctional pirin family protein/GNAT family N-acetyltransferase n=1 Tax=Streptomyces sp. WAC06614 TaxID=2487416 RepID=UPI000F78E618|nr:pirin family protein [Streptomyces sp. WAC06614]RSS67485.1 hypothetical protein EF918_28670 [Streptomyces sp. WAC06614]
MDHPEVEVLTARDVPLGGPRAMTVRRTLPQRARTLIGAWCFADHYGPDRVADSGGMDVAPHPHTGLQTVSWLFSGEIEHRDSLGTHAFVRPGEINLMTGGHGISHTEVSTPGTTVLHGVQLWVALPDAHRHAPRAFQHHAPEPLRVDGAELRVFLGTLAGLTAYRDRGDQRVFFHTEIDDAYAGRGLAAILVQQALTDVRASGMRIVPVCPYVASFLTRHQEYADITDPVTPEITTWLDERLGR